MINPSDDVVQLQLASAHTIGSGTLVLQTGQGAKITAPARVTAITNASYGTGRSEVKTRFDVSAVAGDTLTVTVSSGSTDQAFAVGDYVEERVTAPYITDLNTAVTTNTSSISTINTTLATKATDSAVVHNTGSEVIAGAKTFSNTITGSITGNAATVTTISGLISAGTNVTITGAGTSASPFVIASSGGASGITALTGDVTASGTGSVAATLATVNSNVGTFQGLTVNAKGLVTAASNQSYLTANQTITVSGDISGSGTTAITATLATVNSNIGSFGGASSVPSFTVNAKGLVTAASATAVVAPAGTLSGTTLNSTVVTSSLTSVGTIATGTWHGTIVAVAYGGTGVSLASTGGTSQVLQQTTVGGNVTVGQLAASNLSNGTTGSGSVVLATSATLVTPALGTPASGVLTNCTGTASGLTAGAVSTIAGLISAGSNITITGSGTSGSPYSIAASGGGSGITALTGDVTASGTGSVAATIASNAVTYSKFQPVGSGALVGNPTGSSANASEITPDGTSLVFSGTSLLSTLTANYLFGSGQDGTLSISSGTTTLSRDMYYSNVTLSGTAKINANGWKIFVSGTLDISAAGAQAIYVAPTFGNNGSSGGTGGAGVGGPYPLGSLTSTANSGTGGAGGTGNGSAGTGPNGSYFNLGGWSAAAGTGGSGGTGSGGAGGSGANSPTYYVYNKLSTDLLKGVGLYQGGAAGGPSGGGGGGDGTYSGGGGGAQGGPGWIMAIFANTIARGTNSTAAIIQCKGIGAGAGGSPTSGNTGGGGGGSGSGGGFLYLVAGKMTGSTITNALDVTGGNGGNGGTGHGTGNGGNGGGSGGPGAICVYNLAANTNIYQAPAVGGAGGAASGSTGGTGATATTTQYNL